jgi:hypothetical protein
MLAMQREMRPRLVGRYARRPRPGRRAILLASRRTYRTRKSSSAGYSQGSRFRPIMMLLSMFFVVVASAATGPQGVGGGLASFGVLQRGAVIHAQDID